MVVETFRSSTCHGTDCGPSRSSVEDLVSHADNGQRGHLPSNRGISLSGYHDHAVWPVSVIYCNSVNGILCWLALGENRSPICLFDVPAVVQTFTDGHQSLLLFKTQTYWDTSVVFHHNPPPVPASSKANRQTPGKYWIFSIQLHRSAVAGFHLHQLSGQVSNV